MGGSKHLGLDSIQLSCHSRLLFPRTLDLWHNGIGAMPRGLDGNDTTLLIAGVVTSGPHWRPLLVRSDTFARADRSYGDGGVARLDGLVPDGLASVQLVAVDVLPDGGAIVVGDAMSPTRRGKDGALVAFVAKVDSTGSLDTSFSEDGFAEIRIPGNRRASAADVRVLDDGRILVVGWSSRSMTATFQAYAALFGHAGEPDASFGSNGIATPRLGGGATAFTSLPTSSNAGAFPMHVSTSRNVGGSVRPFLVRIEANGAVARWGGPSSQKIETMGGHPRWLQRVDIERARDGSIIGGGELQANGDWDSFIARFRHADGTLDRAWSDGIEPIDTDPGRIDNEYVSAIALSPDGVPWALGAREGKEGNVVSLFRVNGKGTANSALWSSASVFATNGRGSILRCGRSARRPCSVRRGRGLRIVAGAHRWMPHQFGITRPYLRIWSKPPRKQWTVREQMAGRPFRSAGYAVIGTNLRLGVGVHQVYLHRNGGSPVGAAWSAPLYVRVR